MSWEWLLFIPAVPLALWGGNGVMWAIWRETRHRIFGEKDEWYG